ncbi:MAG: hypothetical protein QF441_16000 [Bacteriovoracaceae bacterium]|jgi:hemoglobin|nr:hypothetical protein [Halobacteriovoraceae bacterium]MDP7322108.1 hypothetical protein [Bacteriovoracaceae bacterium]
MIQYNLLHKIITSFYDKAKKDILIGYHFRIIEDFDPHIVRITDFWNLQLNGQIQDKSHLPFKLLEVHKELKINKGEVFRWVKLFQENLEHYEANNEITLYQKEIWLQKVGLFRDKLLRFLNF